MGNNLDGKDGVNNCELRNHAETDDWMKNE
jgi:hypothetical protein